MKEKKLRKIVKKCLGSSTSSDFHVSWVESHDTAIGIPDLNYCVRSVEGWLELKCGPEIEVRAAQVRWMEERIASGGWPLFLIQYGDIFLVIPGSAAESLRQEPHQENAMRLASAIWQGEPPAEHFLKVIGSPRRQYGK